MMGNAEVRKILDNELQERKEVHGRNAKGSTVEEGLEWASSRGFWENSGGQNLWEVKECRG